MDSEIIQSFYKGENIYKRTNERRRIGISNVRDRIAFLYGDEFGINIESEAGKYTMAKIELPYKVNLK